MKKSRSGTELDYRSHFLVDFYLECNAVLPHCDMVTFHAGLSTNFRAETRGLFGCQKKFSVKVYRCVTMMDDQIDVLLNSRPQMANDTCLSLLIGTLMIRNNTNLR